MIETTLKIDGMMCDMCEAHVNQAVRNSIKIKKVSSSHKTGQAVILSEAPVDIEKVGKALLNISSPALIFSIMGSRLFSAFFMIFFAVSSEGAAKRVI